MEFLFVFILIISFTGNLYGENFYEDVDITWGNSRAKILGNGNLVTLSLDNISGSQIRSKDEYLFGMIDMQIKLVKGNSAGTVTAYYLSSLSPNDEIDFEFLGNLSNQPYIVHTNIYTKGQGNREQQFYLWFDPTADFHIYSILWNPKNIIFYIDGFPIRIFQNHQSRGVPFPSNKPMRLYGSIWHAGDWATQGGRIKIDWRYSPFIASFRNFKANACVWSKEVLSCKNNSPKSWFSHELDSTSIAKLKWVQKTYMVYDYCLDNKRFPLGLPRECTMT